MKLNPIDGVGRSGNGRSLVHVQNCFVCNVPSRGDALLCSASPGDRWRRRTRLWSGWERSSMMPICKHGTSAPGSTCRLKQLELGRRQVDVEIERLKLQQTAIASGMTQDWDGMSWNSTD